MPPRLAVPSLLAMGSGQPGGLLCVPRNLIERKHDLLLGASRLHVIETPYAKPPAFLCVPVPFLLFHLGWGHSVCRGHSCTAGSYNLTAAPLSAAIYCMHLQISVRKPCLVSCFLCRISCLLRRFSW
jgi:hypothetical protein